MQPFANNFNANYIFFRKAKNDLICISVTGELPVTKGLGYIEVLDDGKETVTGKYFRSMEKSADYDFTVAESTEKDGKRKMVRQIRFQFSEWGEKLRIEYKPACCTKPVILYFEQKPKTESVMK